jgi:ankyrin repeat protein
MSPKAGYDTMASWDRTAFEFNEEIQKRGGLWTGNIAWTSQPGRSISQDDYTTPSPSPVELPAAPSFQDATSSWSPPPSPTTRSRSGTFCHSPSAPSSPRVDSARVVESPGTTPLSAKEKNHLADKLYSAAADGDLDQIKLLLHLGAPIDAGTIVKELYEAFKPAKSGRLSPLAGAATHGQLDAVELLLLHGASINPTNNQSSSSPLHQAIRANDIEIARFLLELGANVNSLNCYKTTPLMYAVKYGSVEMVKLILEYKPDQSQLSFIGASAIHWAVWPDRPEILELLLQAGADKNHPMAENNTPLHCAATGGHLATAACLLKYGADPLRRNDDWRTPLEVAEESRHWEIAELIKAAARRKLVA